MAEKRALTREDIKFLKKLQKGLLEHETENSVFWTLSGLEKEYDVEEETCDGIEIYNTADYDEKWDLGDFFDYIEKELEKKGYLAEFSFTDYYMHYGDIWKGDDNVGSFEELLEVIEWLDKNDFGSYGVKYYRNHYNTIIPNTLFLTQEDAVEHLKVNSCDYPYDARAYSQKSNSAEYENLIKLLKEVDFDKIFI